MSKIEIKKNDKEQIYCKCNHCGNTGFLDIKSSFSKIYYIDELWAGYPKESMEYYLLECLVCSKPVYCGKHEFSSDPIAKLF